MKHGATIHQSKDYISTIHAFFPFILRPYSVILSTILTKSKNKNLSLNSVNHLNTMQYSKEITYV